ncbi:MAG: 3'-5' exonuclease [Victivallaceae bacterium]
MKICCIDFETANSARGSACAVGLAWIEAGQITGSTGKLIRPHRSCDQFDPFNIGIHGIHPRDVADAPEFGELAPWLFAMIEADLVVAHNAAFDMSVLRALCALYGLPYPAMRYLCSCKSAMKLWPELENHKLDTLAGHIGHCFEHHDAEADAATAGKLLLAMLNAAGSEDPFEFAKRLGITVGTMCGATYTPCSCKKVRG